MALHWRIIIALLLGAIVGAALSALWTPATWAWLGVGNAEAYLAGIKDEANAGAGIAAGGARFLVNVVRLTGDLFIRLLRFIAIPVTLFSLIVGVASLGDVRRVGKLGAQTLLIFLVTTVLAIVVGLAWSNTVKPGHFVSEEQRGAMAAARAAEVAQRVDAAAKAEQGMSGWAVVRNLVPTNPFRALVDAEMLQIIVLAVLIGIGLTMVGVSPGQKAHEALRACAGLSEAFIAITQAIMAMAPYAVFALITPVVATMGLDVLRALAVYCAVVVGALCTVQFGVYPLAILLFSKGRVGPRAFFRATAPAQLLAFSSSSSAATLAVNIECVEKRLGVPASVASFVLPLGATINMNGTALYQAVAATFLAQLYGIPLTLADQAMIVATATLVSVGSAGVPGASIVLMVIVLESIHVPPAGIAVILGVDRVLDMCRTVTNITGDSMTATLISAREGTLVTPAETDSAGA